MTLHPALSPKPDVSKATEKSNENPYQPTAFTERDNGRSSSTFVAVIVVYVCVLGAIVSYASPWLGSFMIIPLFLLGIGLSIRIALTKRNPSYIKVLAGIGFLLNLTIGGGVLALFVFGFWFWSTFEGPG